MEVRALYVVSYHCNLCDIATRKNVILMISSALSVEFQICVFQVSLKMLVYWGVLPLCVFLCFFTCLFKVFGF